MNEAATAPTVPAIEVDYKARAQAAYEAVCKHVKGLGKKAFEAAYKKLGLMLDDKTLALMQEGRYDEVLQEIQGGNKKTPFDVPARVKDPIVNNRYAACADFLIKVGLFAESMIFIQMISDARRRESFLRDTWHAMIKRDLYADVPKQVGRDRTAMNAKLASNTEALLTIARTLKDPKDKDIAIQILLDEKYVYLNAREACADELSSSTERDRNYVEAAQRAEGVGEQVRIANKIANDITHDSTLATIATSSMRAPSSIHTIAAAMRSDSARDNLYIKMSGQTVTGGNQDSDKVRAQGFIEKLPQFSNERDQAYISMIRAFVRTYTYKRGMPQDMPELVPTLRLINNAKNRAAAAQIVVEGLTKSVTVALEDYGYGRKRKEDKRRYNSYAAQIKSQLERIRDQAVATDQESVKAINAVIKTIKTV